MKLIKIEWDHFIIIDDSPIRQNDSFYLESRNLIAQYLTLPPQTDAKKIIYSTHPIEFGYIQKGKDIVSAKVYNRIKPITQKQVQDIIGDPPTQWELELVDNKFKLK